MVQIHYVTRHIGDVQNEFDVFLFLIFEGDSLKDKYLRICILNILNNS